MDELIKGQIELQKQVRELKTLVQANQPSPQPAVKTNFDFDVSGAPNDGVAQAPLIMVELSDFQCPFCARFDQETYPAIVQNYVHTGKLRYVFENFPLQNIHALARELAETSKCLSAQKDFWSIRQALFANQGKLASKEEIENFAKTMGVNMAAYQACRRDKAIDASIDQSVTQASAAGVSGTPTFLIGRNEPGTTKFKVLKVIVGAQPFAQFKQTFDTLLNTPNT